MVNISRENENSYGYSHVVDVIIHSRILRNPHEIWKTYDRRVPAISINKHKYKYKYQTLDLLSPIILA